MLEVIDTRDPATPAHIGQHPTKPFAMVRYYRTYGGREVATLIDRHASKAEAEAGWLRVALQLSAYNPRFARRGV